MFSFRYCDPLTQFLPSPAVAEIEEEVECRVDCDEEVVHAHHDGEPLERKKRENIYFWNDLMPRKEGRLMPG